MARKPHETREGSDPKQEQMEQEHAEQNQGVASEKSAFLTNGKFYSIQQIPGIGEAIGPIREVFDTSTSPVRHFNYRIPGILQVVYRPTFGIADSFSDPVNQAGQALYNDVQDAMNNRNLPFQGGDLLKAILAMDSIQQLYLLIHRAYCTLGKADLVNDYLPQGLFRAYGFSYSDWRDNKAMIREDLLTWKEQLESRYPCPNVFKLMHTHSQMARFVYGDNNSRKAQFYVCVPDVLWSWEGADTAMHLEPIAITTTPGSATYATIRAKMFGMINAIIDSTDFQRIIAALNTTYSTADRISYPNPLTENVVDFVYDEGFNNCLMNATILTPYSNAQGTIRWSADNVNLILSSFRLEGTEIRNFEQYAGDGAFFRHVINADKDMPTAEEMTNMMRWHYNVIRGTDGNYYAESIGTEVITRLYLVGPNNEHRDFLNGRKTNADGSDTQVGLLTETQVGTVVVVPDLAPVASVTTARSIQSYFALLGALDAFDAMPILYLFTANYEMVADDAIYERYVVPVVHWHFMAETNANAIRAYHKAELWSAFLER